MRTKFYLVMFSAMLLCGIVRSQSLSPTVISSAGGFYTSGSAMLSFTVAEMTMVETFTSTNNMLTQGFQQPEDLSVDIPETPVYSGDVMIYPNPTSGQFMLTYTSNSNTDNTIRLYDLLGQVVLSKSVSQQTGSNTVIFDIGAFSQGIYMLELTTENAQGEKQTSFSKINLVY